METFIKVSAAVVLMQNMVKVLKNPQQIELFENPNYTRIIGILRKGELTIKEIHEYFNTDYEDKKTLTSIYRYMETLTEHDLVFVSKEELKKGHLIERYYSRTAQIFLFEDERLEEDALNAAVELLQEIYGLDSGCADELKGAMREWMKDMERQSVNFFKKYGPEVFALEKKYGFNAVKTAAKAFYEFLYFREHPDVFKSVFEILEG
jgi:Fe2+ or Zn2+ uptake regulation protein